MLYPVAQSSAGMTSQTDNVDEVAIDVSMAAGHASKLQAKRASQPWSMHNDNQRMPLANKYAHLGARGLHAKELNKFPSSNAYL